MTGEEKNRRFEDGTAISLDEAIEELVSDYRTELEEMHPGDILYTYQKEFGGDYKFIIDEKEVAEDGTPYTAYLLAESRWAN